MNKVIFVVLFLLLAGYTFYKLDYDATNYVLIDNYKIEVFQYEKYDKLPEKYNEIDRSKLVISNKDIKKMYPKVQLDKYVVIIKTKDKEMVKQISGKRGVYVVLCINDEIISSPQIWADTPITNGILLFGIGDEKDVKRILNIEVEKIEQKQNIKEYLF